MPSAAPPPGELPEDLPEPVRPHLEVVPTPTPSTAILVLLHGGPERGFREASRLGAPYLRMIPYGRAVRRRSEDRIAVVRLRHRHNGWNGAAASTAVEARLALDDLAEAAPGVPIGLLGHSLGGRTALRVADHRAVRSVVALAPWLPPGEDVQPLADRDVLILHGAADLVCPIADTEAFVRRARADGRSVAFERLAGAGHLMLRRAPLWHDLAATFLVRTLLPDDPSAGATI
ncbi:alpha-beta hydrolase superfamily lysophospholipase [Kineosphaera limosa]|uniref:AB hydrolase-1 domain-containing protein n=1 Tax=Kineosphaera limosa NBRC 100340 TaxID=1184609 RepID=K6WTD2_9MICO|nr:alpha/beta fold hydrolase [Kineosphaera limosa]NYE00318.1 alpha-beta hydrolase superfamily lysophospholipase [Kineosphaera limosa]GAB97116.1 hypothetical protein KILIM_057_00070 [Kineosphaera limosa NBRC 100340]